LSDVLLSYPSQIGGSPKLVDHRSAQEIVFRGLLP